MPMAVSIWYAQLALRAAESSIGSRESLN